MLEGVDFRSCLIGSAASIVAGIGTIATWKFYKFEPELHDATMQTPHWVGVETESESDTEDLDKHEPALLERQSESTATWVRRHAHLRQQQRQSSGGSTGSLPLPKKKQQVSRSLSAQRFGPEALYDKRNTSVEGTHQHHSSDSAETLDTPPPVLLSMTMPRQPAPRSQSYGCGNVPGLDAEGHEHDGIRRKHRHSEVWRLGHRHHTQVVRSGSCPMAESTKPSRRRSRVLVCLPELERIKHGKTVDRLREHGINVTSDQVEGLLTVFGKAAEEMSETDFAACFDYFRSLMMEGICGEGGKKNHIFLGGACNPSTWRKEITIPMLAAEGIFETHFYNPQVDNWTPDLVALEAKAKFQSKILLFVIGEETRAIASMIEAAEHVTSANREEQTVVVVIKDVHTEVPAFKDVPLSAAELKDLNRGRAYLADVVSRHGCIVFKDVVAATHHIIELFYANKLLEEAPQREDTLDVEEEEEERSFTRSYSI